MPKLELQVELRTGRRFFLEMTASPKPDVEDIEGWVQDWVALRADRNISLAGVVSDDYHDRAFVAVPGGAIASLSLHMDALERFKLRVSRDREDETDD